MKLYMNINLRSEKHYLTSLNYVVTTQKKIYIFIYIYFLRLLLAFTNIFLFNDGLKLSKVRNNLLEKMNQMGLHCFRKHVLSTNFHGTEKKSKEIVREYGKYKKKSNFDLSNNH